MGMTRKNFLKAGAAVVTTGLALGACGDDEEASTTTGPGSTTGGGMGASSSSSSNNSSSTASGMGGAGPMSCTNMIAANHGHVLVVPDADVTAGVDATYNIQGTSAHPHFLLVAAADFATLQMGGSVMLTSMMGGGHTHDVTITCPGGGGGMGGSGGAGGSGGTGGTGGTGGSGGGGGGN